MTLFYSKVNIYFHSHTPELCYPAAGSYVNAPTKKLTEPRQQVITGSKLILNLLKARTRINNLFGKTTPSRKGATNVQFAGAFTSLSLSLSLLEQWAYIIDIYISRGERGGSYYILPAFYNTRARATIKLLQFSHRACVCVCIIFGAGYGFLILLAVCKTSV